MMFSEQMFAKRCPVSTMTRTRIQEEGHVQQIHRATGAVVLALGAAVAAAAGGAYPNKPIRFIVPAAAGGPRKSSPACWPSA